MGQPINENGGDDKQQAMTMTKKIMPQARSSKEKQSHKDMKT